MDLSGNSTIDASREAIWAVLEDVDGLATCGPGIGPIERVGERHARVRITVGSGFFATRVGLELELGEVERAERVTMTARGEASGTKVVGDAALELSGPPEGPTTLAWRASVQVSGAMAGIATRLIESEAGRLLDAAVDCVRSRALARPAG